ncbi:hypothetical protein FHS89_000345 [Rubricella aquisinus]|uniref:Excinuclease ABC subunit B n=1 Tax=Rubricella aquisinus TaxID=2028108 RepID=A0A840X104_9RHOB|nr:hypothetical protein [Rubricella aquisinus]MBB5514347.1 hypothetical protein [Rubricella aquisinus]
MRFFAVLLALFPLPVLAWEVEIGPVCTLTHATADAQVVLTYDPARPWYSITVTRDTDWPAAALFSMEFVGPAPNRISTSRHQFSADQRAIRAEDRGFGNVLDGLQFNEVAYAIAGDARVAIPLDGAADAVALFRDCRPVAGV